MTNTPPPAESFPLFWPEGRPRCRSVSRSAFKTTGLARVRDDLLNELKLLGARQVVISTNVPLRRDGLPYAGQPQPKDPGVAVYFTRNGRQLCFACDRWHKVEDNLWAIAKTIDALRGIARWGTGDMIEAAFRGFAALPPKGRPWRQVLGIPDGVVPSSADLDEAYRRASLAAHPDRGGSNESMAEVNEAVARARAETNGQPT
jgi:hypothetical protein